jgi:superfamily II DNA or RNA helicase
MPLHSKAKDFARSGLFAGVTSFEELEKRIAAIPENKGKGDAFEVFAEAYLATQRKHDAKQVWPLSATPLDLLGKLGLGGMDYGVDGILQTLLGDLSAYQVKFRTGREPMTWRELSTFMGLADSPHIRSRILITNCDELSPVINERQGFFCIRGSDLDRMEAADFQAIEAWLAEAAIQATKKKPLPHQEEALAAIVPTLQKESRATAIMACGTGKTLVTLWTAEQLGARKVLVLLPSLALLRQTLHEWLKETSLESLAYLCVCSDPTVKADADEISTAQSDLDFEVSTDPGTVRRFLDAPFEGTKIVFSTYQSASVVGEAMKPEESFDIGIFDEAHKTAGREGRNYGYALDDSKIRIEKRLFVTATPRHYNPSKQTKEGEATIAFSMDDPKVYGEQCYTLSFSKAANLGIICGYKVIISVITSDQVNNEILSRGIVEVKGDEIRARQVANQIALRDAVNQYGVGKVFTFHSTVKSAASFVSQGNEGVRTHLPEFDAFHVSGAMPTAHREKLMQEFRRIDRGVMSNARCLTEGVDVPAVDMVAFLSPKKSKVDIVQAIGRAMRKSPGKEIGYVLVPLYLEQREGETLEEAVARTNFEEVWDILQSLKEQDEVLADLIREMSEAKGRGKGEKEQPLGDRIDFVGPILSLESLRESITARTLERLESSWDVNFGKLVKFKEEHGHCNVPHKYERDHQLGNWIVGLRSRKERLSLERITKLYELGFQWDIRDDQWSQNLEELKFFKSKFGHCRVAKSYDSGKLHRWVRTQRRCFVRGNISKDRQEILEDLGFTWDSHEDIWEENFQKLESFKAEFGHCEAPRDWNDIKFATWVRSQRGDYTKKVISQDRINRLEKLGFKWNIRHSIWDHNYNKLVSYKNQHAHCRVPYSYTHDPDLGRWVVLQRARRDKISQEHIEKLNLLGFEWSPIDTDWEQNYSLVKDFYALNGHCNISPKDIGFSKKLQLWINHQRKLYSKKKLPADHIAKLEAICIQLIPQKKNAWNINFVRLVRFKEKFSHHRVSPIEDFKLHTWIQNQRSLYINNKLSPERILKLNSIAFTWNQRKADWEENFDKLLIFKNQYNHCRVPQVYKNDHKLGSWVNSQRQNYAKGKLPQEYISRLDEIGFEWKLRG